MAAQQPDSMMQLTWRESVTTTQRRCVIIISMWADDGASRLIRFGDRLDDFMIWLLLGEEYVRDLHVRPIGGCGKVFPSPVRTVIPKKRLVCGCKKYLPPLA